MTPPRGGLAFTITAAADRYEPQMIEALLRSFAAMQNAVDRAALTRLLDRGDLRGALSLLGMDEMVTALEPAAGLVRSAFAEGVTLGAAPTPAPWPEAQAFASRHAGEMVKGISEETRLALRNAVHGAIRDGIPRRDLERTIRGLIGLNTPQTAASLAYRQSLIDAGLPLDKVNIRSERYIKKKIRERANTIARYESMSAMNAGRREADLRAQAMGWLGPKAKKGMAGVRWRRQIPRVREMFRVEWHARAPRREFQL